MKKLYHIIFSALFLAASCGKEDIPKTPLEQLPPATMEGANTFGCLVNGEAFIPNSILGNPNPQIPLNFSYHEESGTLKIIATMRDVNNTWRIKLFGVFDTKGLTDIRSDKYRRIYSDNHRCVDRYIIDSLNRLNITYLDKEQNILSGEFTFEAVHPNCPEDTVFVTDGRFDLNYRD